MPADLLKLDALTRTAIRTATAAYLSGGSIDTWEKAMQQAITRGHTAATLAGIAERGIGGRIREALSRLVGDRALSKADRVVLRERLREQVDYLRGFVTDVKAEKLSEARIRQRADMYAGATRATYYAARWGEWEIPDRLMPGNQQCLSNCRCSISVADNGDGTGVLTRIMGGEWHCTECPPLAGDHPVKRRAV